MHHAGGSAGIGAGQHLHAGRLERPHEFAELREQRRQRFARGRRNALRKLLGQLFPHLRASRRGT